MPGTVDSSAILGLPMWATTLNVSQSIPTGYQCALQGTLTIPTSITLTIVGTGYLTISRTLILQ